MYDILKEIMKEKNINANQLAFASSITPSDLSAALSGKKPFFPNWRKRVAEALDINADELFAEDEVAVLKLKAKHLKAQLEEVCNLLGIRESDLEDEAER